MKGNKMIYDQENRKTWKIERPEKVCVGLTLSAFAWEKRSMVIS